MASESSASEHSLRPGQVFARRVREARKGRGWTQAELAERVRERTGYPISRVTITKIERGEGRAENTPLQEILVLAAALDVAPVHLLAPLENEAAVKLGDKLTVPATYARAWVRGLIPLPGGDLRWFMLQMPDAELRSLLRQVLLGRGVADVPANALVRALDPSSRDVSDELLDQALRALRDNDSKEGDDD